LFARAGPGGTLGHLNRLGHRHRLGHLNRLGHRHRLGHLNRLGHRHRLGHPIRVKRPRLADREGSVKWRDLPERRYRAIRLLGRMRRCGRLRLWQARAGGRNFLPC